MTEFIHEDGDLRHLPEASAAEIAAKLGRTGTEISAADVGVVDAGSLLTATNVEAALAENRTLINAGMQCSKRTVTVGHADLTDAVNGHAQVVNIGAVLPTNAVVFACAPTGITPFSGGSVSECKLDVGGTDADAIINALELITDAPTEAEINAAGGLLPQGAYSAQQLTATFTPDAGHPLVDLTAGAVTITAWYFILA